MSNKTSDQNVANDIKILKKFCEYEEAVVLTDNALEEVQDAINNILAERKQDKKKIQELEEIDVANRKVIVEECDYIQNNSIPKQKVKDKIEKLRNDIKLGNCRYPYVEEHKIDILQELLGGDEKK